jgi:hypothetical protein
MPSHESLLIDHALQVLREIARDRSPGSKQTPCLKLALRTLLEHTSQRWWIDEFWKLAGSADQNHRCRSLQKTLPPVAGSVGRTAELFRP